MAFGPRTLFIVPGVALLLWGGVLVLEVIEERQREAAWAAELAVYESRGREAARKDIAAGRPQPMRVLGFQDVVPPIRIDEDTGLPFRVIVAPGFGCATGEAESSAEREAYRREIEDAYAAGDLYGVSFLDRIESLEALAPVDAGADWPELDPLSGDGVLRDRDGLSLRWESYGSSEQGRRGFRITERRPDFTGPTWAGPVLVSPIRAKRVDDGRTLLLRDADGHRWGIDTETGSVLALFPTGESRLSRW